MKLAYESFIVQTVLRMYHYIVSTLPVVLLSYDHTLKHFKKRIVIYLPRTPPRKETPGHNYVICLFQFTLKIETVGYCAVDKIEKNEMGGACGTYGGRERCAQGFGGET